MKRIATIGVLSLVGLLIAAATLSAQEGLTARQEREYNESRLSVEVEYIGEGSYGYGTVSYQEWRKWTPYRGFEKISEADFFQIAGYDEQAEEAASFKQRNDRLFWGGLGACTVGLVVTLATATTDTIAPAIGGVASLGGLIAGGIGAAQRNRNCHPYETADRVARIYNRELLEEIADSAR